MALFIRIDLRHFTKISQILSEKKSGILGVFQGSSDHGLCLDLDLFTYIYNKTTEQSPLFSGFFPPCNLFRPFLSDAATSSAPLTLSMPRHQCKSHTISPFYGIILILFYLVQANYALSLEEEVLFS